MFWHLLYEQPPVQTEEEEESDEKYNLATIHFSEITTMTQTEKVKHDVKGDSYKNKSNLQVYMNSIDIIRRDKCEYKDTIPTHLSAHVNQHTDMDNLAVSNFSGKWDINRIFK